MSFSGFISNAAAMFDMDKMREEILAEEQKTVEQNLSQNKETVTHRSDTLIAKKRRELKDIPVVSASSLLSPDEARKLSSFTTKSGSHTKTRDDRSKGEDVNKNSSQKNWLRPLGYGNVTSTETAVRAQRNLPFSGKHARRTCSPGTPGMKVDDNP